MTYKILFKGYVLVDIQKNRSKFSFLLTANNNINFLRLNLSLARTYVKLNRNDNNEDLSAYQIIPIL